MIRLAWEPERGDCNNPVTRHPSLLRWLGSPGASQFEEGLMACCCCVAPEGDEDVSGVVADGYQNALRDFPSYFRKLRKSSSLQDW